jgi:hypothetical protein
MKRIVFLITIIAAAIILSGCGRKNVSLSPGIANDVTILTLNGNLSNQTQDQEVELTRVITWMDRDILKNMKQTGYNPVLIKDIKDYKQNSSKLLVIEVGNFNAGNRAARAFVGFGAGASSLDLNYKLIDENGDELLAWKDGVGSSKGGTYCAQTLNRNAINKITTVLNN